ncbi:MAG TPA: SRPBCC domain-containing protein [Hanamia sp.]|nr:SRPBCC domain-containing protein [Hanamia sp.]
MDKQLFIKNAIDIDAPASKIWNVLVNPEETKKYMFGCETISDWKPGSDLLWQANYEGKGTVFVKGKIIEIEPQKFLSYTTIDPNSYIADIPQNYLTVTYQLQEENGTTNLMVTQGDYSTVADGEKRFRETMQGGGWEPILIQIKKKVETE